MYFITLKKYSSVPILSAFYQVVETMSILINANYSKVILLTYLSSNLQSLADVSHWLVLTEDRNEGSPKGQLPRAQSRVEKKDYVN